ncbi:MAG: YggT family protein [Acidimicrobiales bacterium]
MGFFTLNGGPLCLIGQLYVIVLLLRAVLSWFPLSSNSPLVPVARFLGIITEPVLAPFRRVIPAAGGLDLSFLIVVLLLEFLIIPLLCRL